MQRDLLYQMRADIVAGRFRQGEWLRLSELERRYGASRFEVRKTLAELKAMQALEHIENYGYRILTPDPDRDLNYMEVRRTLELSAAPAIIELAGKNDLKEMSRLAGRFEWMIENGTYSEMELANHDFHRAFFHPCKNTVLTDMIHNMRELLLPHMQDPHATLAGRRRSCRQHFEMIERLKAKDLDGLLNIMRQHLSRTPVGEVLVDLPADH